MPSATVSLVDDGWDILGGSGTTRAGTGADRIAGWRQSLHRAAALDADRHTVSQCSHRQPRLRHGLATNYFELARADRPDVRDIDLGFFHGRLEALQELPVTPSLLAATTPSSTAWSSSRPSPRLQKVFRRPLELVYEISHNLVQRESHLRVRRGPGPSQRRNPSLSRRPSLARRHAVGRQRLSRADPRQQQGLQLHPAPSGWGGGLGYSVNHGAGRQMSRGEAARSCRRARSMPTIGGWDPREPRWPRAHR